MALRKYKPTTSTRRHTEITDKSLLSTKKPEKKLTTSLRRSAGRNNTGRITVRHKQSGNKKQYRSIDFKRDKSGITATVVSIEYDPYRSANIALLNYVDGEKRYILAPNGIKVGDTVISDEKVEITAGNAAPLKNLPAGIFVHNIELTRGKGGQLCRGAGVSAQIQGGAEGYIQLKMPSGEIRLVKEDNYATIGEVGNLDHGNQKLGKAGRKRGLGWRPTVRGMAMHAKQHPHGGGEAKGQVGGKRKTIYGKKTDIKTRKIKRTNRFIVKRKTSKRRPNVKTLKK
jgi:large subunit ribosomal protein L2